MGVLFCNVLYCSMGSEQYESLTGIGFEGYLIYIVLLFYISIKAYEAIALGSLCTMRRGSFEGQKIFPFCSFPEQ